MKICIINSIYKPYYRGGAEVVSGQIVDQLKRRGHDVFVISVGYENTVEDLDGVRVYRINPETIFNVIDIKGQSFIKRLVWHLQDQWNMQAAEKVAEIVEHENPDRIYTHSLKGLSYQIPKALQTRDRKVIHTLHDVQLVIPSGLLYWGKEKDISSRNLFNTLFALCNKKIFSYCDVILSPSQWLLDFYRERGFFKHQESNVLRNPIQVDKPFFEKEWMYSYGYVGQIEEHKGIRLLLESFDIFHDTHPNAMLYVVGDGSLLPEMKEKYANVSWVKFLGRIPYEELPDTFFNIVNYSVLPSLVYENSPGTVYDGFANSTPVIVPNLAGAPELVVDGETGFVFEPGGHKGLIQALHKTVEHKDQYAWMAMKARTEIEKYSFDEYFKNLGIN